MRCRRLNVLDLRDIHKKFYALGKKWPFIGYFYKMLLSLPGAVYLMAFCSPDGLCVYEITTTISSKLTGSCFKTAWTKELHGSHSEWELTVSYPQNYHFDIHLTQFLIHSSSRILREAITEICLCFIFRLTHTRPHVLHTLMLTTHTVIIRGLHKPRSSLLYCTS
jgi:hypothetical protein